MNKEFFLPDHFTKCKLTHWSASSLNTPTDIWIFKYPYLQDLRRNLQVGVAATAGGAVHDAMEWGVKNGENKPDLYKATEKLKKHLPLDDIDSEKKEHYLDILPDVVSMAWEALNVAGDKVLLGAEEWASIKVEGINLPIIGRRDVYSNKLELELKTKWPTPSTKKDGSRSWRQASLPTKPTADHLRQCSVYYKATGHDISLIYVRQNDYKIFNKDNCEVLEREALDRVFLGLVQKATIRENLVKMCDGDPKKMASITTPDFSHFMWDVGDIFMKEARELWKQ